METVASPLPSEPAATDYSWPATPPGLLEQLWMWLWIGGRSFGGGPAVQILLYDALVVRRRWLSPADYARTWGMCQVVPGINLFSFAIVVGRKVGGLAGIAVALVGMGLPGSVVVVLCTIAFVSIRHSPVTIAAFRGGVAGVAGIGLFMGARLLIPQLREAAAVGRGRVTGVAAIFVSVALAFFFLPGVPIVLVFVLAGAAMLGVGRLSR